MNDSARLKLLKEAEAALKATKVGYPKTLSKNPHWREAMGKLHKVMADLDEAAIPQLGPIVPDGVPVLLQDCTHITDGLGWPAFDDGFGHVGAPVFAPERVRVYDNTSGAQGGDAFYLVGDSTIRYWVGHILEIPRLNAVFVKGQKMTTIARTARPHVHLGIDARPLIGHHLLSHTDYTHGAPKIGVQLAAAMT
jgi:hypothetical protein